MEAERFPFDAGEDEEQPVAGVWETLQMRSAEMIRQIKMAELFPRGNLFQCLKNGFIRAQLRISAYGILTKKNLRMESSAR